MIDSDIAECTAPVLVGVASPDQTGMLAGSPVFRPCRTQYRLHPDDLRDLVEADERHRDRVERRVADAKSALATRREAGQALETASGPREIARLIEVAGEFACRAVCRAAFVRARALHKIEHSHEIVTLEGLATFGGAVRLYLSSTFKRQPGSWDEIGRVAAWGGVVVRPAEYSYPGLKAWLGADGGVFVAHVPQAGLLRLTAHRVEARIACERGRVLDLRRDPDAVRFNGLEVRSEDRGALSDAEYAGLVVAVLGPP